jgi:alkylated DNA nucleotide flippase Atl1
MKHKAARIINRKLSKMTRDEELAYWRGKTKHSHLKQSKTKKTLAKV